MSGKTLVWTRAREDWQGDQPLLARLSGVDVLHIPCLETAALVMKVPPGPWDYAVFTSRNAVQFALATPWFRPMLAAVKTCFTFGRKTHAQLVAAGLSSQLVDSAATGEELAHWLQGTLPKGARVLVPGAEVPAFDLAKALADCGFAAVSLPCYRTKSDASAADGSALPPQLIRELTGRLAGVVAFASPSAVTGFVKAFSPRENRLAATLTAAVIGPTTAATARRFFDKVQIAPKHDLDSLVALCRNLL